MLSEAIWEAGHCWCGGLYTRLPALPKTFSHHNLLSDALRIHILILENNTCSMGLAKGTIYYNLFVRFFGKDQKN
jgi:hypothetical protein